MSMRWKFYLLLLSIAPIEIGFIVVFALSTGNWMVLACSIPVNLFFLVVVNFFGLRIIFRPIGDFLEGGGDFLAARRRLDHLPRITATWIFILVPMFSVVAFFFNPIAMGLDVVNDMPVREKISVIGLYTIYFTFLTYFIADDLAANMPVETFYRYTLANDDPRPRFAAKFIVVMVICALVPILNYVNVVYTHPLEAIPREVMQNLISVVFAVAVAAFFVVRSMNRPMRQLMDAVTRIRPDGHNFSRLKILDNDEFGTLTAAYNDMVEGLKEREYQRKRSERQNGLTRSVALREKFEPELRRATIMMIDLEDFAGVTDQLEARSSLDILDDFYAAATQIATDRGGMVINAVFDTVLIAFNLPRSLADFERRAVEAALEIHKQLKNETLVSGLKVGARIGIATGDVIAGNMEADANFGYTVLGEAVDAATNLERLCRNSKVPGILLCPRTAIAVENNVDLAEVMDVSIPGQSEEKRFKIFAPSDMKEAYST